MEQQRDKDDNSEHEDLACTGQIVARTGTIDSTDIVKLENENEPSVPSFEKDEVSEDKGYSTVTEVVLINASVVGEDRIKECDDIIVNIEEKANSSAQPTPFETESDFRRKSILHRAPRYFDPQECSLSRYYEPGENNDDQKKRKKRKKQIRCYNCGDTGHPGTRCKYVTVCFICSEKGHLIKDCPQQNIEVDTTSRLCLKCGNKGHDMFACNRDYSFEDLKEIQCYVCKDFGHLCCAEYNTDDPIEASCYKCGGSGHFGSVCALIEVPIVEEPKTFCSKCTKKGHFKRSCRKCKKARKAAASRETTASGETTASEKIAAAEATMDSAKGKKSRKRAREEKKLMRMPKFSNVPPIRHKAIWPIPPVIGPYYGKPGSNVWLSPALAAAAANNSQNGQNNPRFPPLTWTRQPVKETSQQPQIEAQVPQKPLYHFTQFPSPVKIQRETEFRSEMLLPNQSFSNQDTVPLPCRNSNNESINQNCTGSPVLSASEPSPAS